MKTYHYKFPDWKFFLKIEESLSKEYKDSILKLGKLTYDTKNLTSDGAGKKVPYYRMKEGYHVNSRVEIPEWKAYQVFPKTPQHKFKN